MTLPQVTQFSRRRKRFLLLPLLFLQALLIYAVADGTPKAAAVTAVLSTIEIAVSVFRPEAALRTSVVALATIGGISAVTDGSATVVRVDAASQLTNEPPVAIVTPTNDAEVDRVASVTGTTQLGEAFHYYLWAGTGSSKRIAARLFPAGTLLTGSVHLGDTAVGRGLRYELQIIASSSPIPLDTSDLPENITVSAVVMVVRR